MSLHTAWTPSTKDIFHLKEQIISFFIHFYLSIRFKALLADINITIARIKLFMQKHINKLNSLIK